MTHSTDTARQVRSALWRGAPLPDELLLETPPASAPVRAAIYAAARTQAAQLAARPQPLWARARHGLHVLVHGRLGYGAWAACAAGIFMACIWLGSGARAPRTTAQQSPLDEFVTSTLALCDEATLAPLTEPAGLDLEDDALHANLQKTASAIAWLEDDLHVDVFASNN
jgi:hypothetical protein